MARELGVKLRIREGCSISYYNPDTTSEEESLEGVIKRIDKKNKVAFMEDGTEVNINSPNISIADD